MHEFYNTIECAMNEAICKELDDDCLEEDVKNVRSYV